MGRYERSALMSRQATAASVRQCDDCSELRPLSEFYGGRGHCQACQDVRSVKNRNAKKRRKWAAMTPEQRRAAGHRTHGRPLTPEEFAAKEAAQGGRCAICGTAPGPRIVGRPRADGTRALASGLSYDHDHASGAGRDLLCQDCNVMLGHARDEPERLEAAAAYLRRHRLS